MPIFKFDCGDKVRCKISGFEGVITSRTQWFNNCVRYCVQPRGTKKTEMLEAKHFDEQELELVQAQAVPSVTAPRPPTKRTGGPAGSRSGQTPRGR